MKTLWEILDLDPKRHRMIAYVGAGGKSAAMYEMAKEAAKEGLRVMITTSTRIWKPEQQVLTLQGSALEARGACAPGEILTVGMDAEPGKLKGLSEEETEKLLKECDLLLYEADGSKQMPFKVPEQWEPVILKCTQAVVAVAGLSAFQKPMGQVCFRMGRASEEFGAGEEDILTPELAAEILSSRRGQKKQVGSRAYRILLNQADMPKEQILGRLTAQELRRLGETHCAMMSFHSGYRERL